MEGQSSGITSPPRPLYRLTMELHKLSSQMGPLYCLKQLRTQIQTHVTAPQCQQWKLPCTVDCELTRASFSPPGPIKNIILSHILHILFDMFHYMSWYVHLHLIIIPPIIIQEDLNIHHVLLPSYEASSAISCISLLASASDSRSVASSTLLPSLVVAGSNSDTSGISTIPKIMDISVDFSRSTSLCNTTISAFKVVTSSVAPWPRLHTAIFVARGSMVELNAWVIGVWETIAAARLRGSAAVEELGTSEGVAVEVPEGPWARVGKDASADMSLCPQPGKGWFGMLEIDSFWDDMIILLMKPNQYRATTLRSFFLIKAPISSHLGVSSKINGANQFFILSSVLVLIMHWQS
ncbi:hypothetical protein H5410_026694 [Solanum commersonii]|uniref:Uncharacterized protein n=1 Tax=Solanum commersonii TaxID=4109 RepID=A0A9J5YXR7_SOLCO|nr:hypothetical protein H5410_026694 [Solanum commersonii]